MISNLCFFSFTEFNDQITSKFQGNNLFLAREKKEFQAFCNSVSGRLLSRCEILLTHPRPLSTRREG
jgi:hypothetical protein